MLAESRHLDQSIQPSMVPDTSEWLIGVDAHIAVVLWDEAEARASYMKVCHSAANCYEKFGSDY